MTRYFELVGKKVVVALEIKDGSSAEKASIEDFVRMFKCEMVELSKAEFMILSEKYSQESSMPSDYTKALKKEYFKHMPIHQKIERFKVMLDDTNFTDIAEFAVGFVPYFFREALEIVERNLIAWDTSKDKKEGMLPEIYLRNKSFYKELTGKEYNFLEVSKRYEGEGE